jgi:transcriptional regulator GlxA family with amidase domain
METVGVVVFDRVDLFGVGLVVEVFGVDRSEDGVPPYQLLICAVEPGAPVSVGGLTVTAPHTLADLDRADLVVVPSWRAPLEEPPPQPLLDALRRAHARGARLLGTCTGGFVLAAAGLLDDRPATTHWKYAAQLAEWYPRVRVDPNVLYVDDGDVLTSAGTAAGIDACLHLVRQDRGAAAANVVARRMVVPPHRSGGQAQYVPHPVPVQRRAPDPLESALVWAQAHLDQPLTVDDLARQAHLARRTFARQFRDSTGTTPLQWLLHQRIGLAQRLLETTELPVEVIAERTGFGSPVALRQHFARIVGTSPRAFRRAFRTAA